MSVRERLRARRALRALPPPVAAFHAAAQAHARAVGDAWSLQSATRPINLAALLDLARGAHTVVELGTATGWTTVALAIDDPDRHVTSYDPIVQPNRAAYVALAPEGARARIDFVQAPGADGPLVGGPRAVEFLFIDSTHERAGTAAEFRAWLPCLAADAVVAFHDYGHPEFPGVAEAIADLGLHGAVRDGTYVWRAPGDPQTPPSVH